MVHRLWNRQAQVKLKIEDENDLFHTFSLQTVLTLACNNRRDQPWISNSMLSYGVHVFFSRETGPRMEVEGRNSARAKLDMYGCCRLKAGSKITSESVGDSDSSA